MIVNYFADIRLLTGMDEQRWREPAPTLRHLLLALADEHGPAFRERIFNDGHLRGSLVVFINGHNVVHLKGLDTRLEADDAIAIFPIIAGG